MPMLHYMNLNCEPFQMLESGQKTIELRLNDEKRQLIKKGDSIIFHNRSDDKRTLLCRVMNLFLFDSFDELYKSLPLLKCGYTESNISTAKAEDMNRYYSCAEQRRFGVIGIEICVIGNTKDGIEL